MNIQFASSHALSASLSYSGLSFDMYMAGLPHEISFFPLYLSVA